MTNKLKDLMSDHFFSYNQSSFFIHTVTLNLYLLRHLHYLKYNEKIFTIKSVLDNISDQHRIFGYSELSVQNSIRELDNIGIIKTERDGREKYFQKLDEEVIDYLVKNKIINVYSMIMENVVKHFNSLNKDDQELFKKTLRITKFWEIISETIDQPSAKMMNLGAFNRFKTLQNVHVLGIGSEYTDFNNSAVMKDLYDLLLYTGKIIGIIVFPNYFINEENSKNISRIEKSKNILEQQIGTKSWIDIDEILALEEKGRFNQALNFISQAKTEHDYEFQFAKIRLLHAIGQLNESEKLLEQLIIQYEVEPDIEKKIALLVHKIEQLKSKFKFSLIKPLISKIQDLVGSTPNNFAIEDTLVWGRFLRIRAEVDIDKSNHEEAMSVYKESLQIFEKHKAIRDIGITYARIAIGYMYYPKYDEAEKHARLALKISRELSNAYDEAEASNRLGMIYFYQMKVDESLEWYGKALGYYERNNYVHRLMTLYGNVGGVYRQRGQFDIALEFMLKSYDIAVESNSETIETGTCNNIGNLYKETGELELAMEWYLKATKNVEWLSNNKRFNALLLRNIGIIYTKQGYYKQALAQFKTTESLQTEIKNNYGLVDSLHDIGNIYRIIGDVNLAAEYLEKALAKRTEFGTPQLIAIDKQKLAIVYFEMARYDEARKMIDECYETRTELDNKIILAEVVSFSIIIHMMLKNEKTVMKRFMELEKIHNDIDSEMIENQYILGMTRLLLQGEHTRTINEVAANELYGELIGKTLVDMEQTNYAKLQRSEYLLKEYQTSQDSTSLNELISLILELQHFASKQESHILRIQILIIDAKLARLTFNSDKSIELLGKAKEMASERGLYRIRSEIDNELKISENLVSLEENDMRSDSTLYEKQKIDEYINSRELLFKIKGD
ncbi:MAG: tetratricopeptide repeat protein [Candidatus Heimdallarchaeota archaeon]|nr:tetratricopeptide repeat protein [Candidatus Heimdallarchaeota archaeon]